MNVLIVDDQRSARHALHTLLRALPDVTTAEAASLDEAREVLARRAFDLALVDIRLGADPRNRDGLTLLRELGAQGRVTVVMITGSHEMDEIRAAMRHGAYDYVLKDDLSDEVLARVVEDVRAFRERVTQPPPVRSAPRGAEELVGASPAMERLRSVIRRVAPSTRPALIRGPTGAGKELVARALHEAGAHPEAPMFDMNCGSIPESLIESALFGHERGAFTGADRRVDGCFATVGEGTLFLDEIGELPLALQPRLLRVLETGRFRRVGSHVEQSFRGRIVAATHVDLEERVARGAFREDLFYRLNVLVVTVPALADHPEDIPELAAHFAASTGRALRFADDALAALAARPWPGNARELRNLVDRLAVFSEDDEITVASLRAVASLERPAPPRARSLDEVIDAVLELALPDTLDALVTGLVDEALARSDGNKTEAARLLGVHRKALARRLDRQRAKPGGAK